MINDHKRRSGRRGAPRTARGGSEGRRQHAPSNCVSPRGRNARAQGPPPQRGVVRIQTSYACRHAPAPSTPSGSASLCQNACWRKKRWRWRATSLCVSQVSIRQRAVSVAKVLVVRINGREFRAVCVAWRTLCLLVLGRGVSRPYLRQQASSPTAAARGGAARRRRALFRERENLLLIELARQTIWPCNSVLSFFDTARSERGRGRCIASWGWHSSLSPSPQLAEPWTQ